MTWESVSGTGHTPNDTPMNDQSIVSPFPDVDYPRQPNMNGSVRVNLSTQIASRVADPINNTPVAAGSPSRYRGGSRDMDTANWDDEAALRLRTTLHPPGDVYDYLSLVRKPLGLRKPNLYRLRHAPRESRLFGVAWLVRDPCGIVCLGITWLLIFYAELVVSTIILPRSPSTLFCWICGPIFHALSFLAFVSHIKAFSTDPGTIPIGNATNDVLTYLQETYGDSSPTVVRCLKCLCIKPSRTHHCSICVRCVRKMDHHCPWINNCVGEANQKYFVLFTLYVCSQSLFALYICLHFVIQCAASDFEQCDINPDNTGLTSFFALPISPFAAGAFIIGLAFEGVVFGLFTVIMCIGQIYSIADDETGIESLGRHPPKRERRSRWKNLVIACGSPFSWHWFNPFDHPPPLMPIFPEFADDTYPLLNGNSCTSTANTNLDDGLSSPPRGDSRSSLLWSDAHAHRLGPGSRDILTL